MSGLVVQHKEEKLRLANAVKASHTYDVLYNLQSRGFARDITRKRRWIKGSGWLTRAWKIRSGEKRKIKHLKICKKNMSKVRMWTGGLFLPCHSAFGSRKAIKVKGLGNTHRNHSDYPLSVLQCKCWLIFSTVFCYTGGVGAHQCLCPRF